MNIEPNLVYSQKIEGTEYIVSFYDNYSIKITSSDESKDFTLEQLREVFGNSYYNYNILFDQNYISKLFDDKLINYKQYSYFNNFCSFLRNKDIPNKNIFDKNHIHKELSDFYQILNKNINEKYLQAKENGKELIVFSGEQHYTIPSLVSELIMTFAANNAGIKNKLIESPDNSIWLKFLDAILMQNQDWKFFMVDPLHDIGAIENKWFTWESYLSGEDCGLDTRASAINQSINKTEQSSISSYGAYHLNDICNDPELKSKFDFFVINASPLKSSQAIENIKYFETILKKMLDQELEIAKENKEIDFEKYQLYILEKKGNLHFSQNFDYLSNHEVLQTPIVLNNLNAKVIDILEIVIDVLKEHGGDNQQNIEFLKFLEEQIYTLSAKIEYIYDNPNFVYTHDLFKEEYLKSGRSLGNLSTDEDEGHIELIDGKYNLIWHLDYNNENTESLSGVDEYPAAAA